MKILNGSVFTEEYRFEQKTVLTDGCKISKVVSADASCDASAEDVLDATDCYVIPGLTDVHFHGCVGSGSSSCTVS